MSRRGSSRHFARAQQSDRFLCKADINRQARPVCSIDKAVGPSQGFDPKQAQTFASASAVNANGGWLSWTRPPRNENVAYALQDGFVSLIAQSVLEAHDASIRFRLRLPLLQNDLFKVEFIPWAHRVRQSHLIITNCGEDMGARMRKRDKDCKRVGA
jgi:hypothetical protein